MIKINSQIRAALNAAANPVMAEKDYVECMVLAALFCDGDIASEFVFTGGGSITKAYHISPRQSHDIDLAYVGGHNIRSPKGDSRAQIKKFKSSFRKMVFGPLYERVARLVGVGGRCEILTDLQYRGHGNDATPSPTLHVMYPSCVEYGFGHTAIEILPRKYDAGVVSLRRIAPYAINNVSANVPTVCYEQTFWDKVYALHTFATSDAVNFRPLMSRHYYDVALMASHVNKPRTRRMLDNIVAHQMKFANYHAAPVSAPCDIVLTPGPDMQQKLNRDFRSLCHSQMAVPLPWISIMNALQKLEYELKEIKR